MRISIQQRMLGYYVLILFYTKMILSITKVSQLMHPESQSHYLILEIPKKEAQPSETVLP